MLICVEGCLGVGKTTLVQRFAQHLPICSPRYEPVWDNPFLADFYQQRRYAMHLQYTFLFLQEREYRAGLLQATGGRLVLCDFHPLKSLIFAQVVLEEEQREPLLQVYKLLRIPEPDLFVYLKADESTILSRLRKRGDPYRDVIDLTYVYQVCNAYERFFRTYSGRVVTIDTTHLDYLTHPEELGLLLQQLPYIGAGSGEAASGQSRKRSTSARERKSLYD
jgi:deoxyguanosine kinase